jgi:hypothetical protein
MKPYSVILGGLLLAVFITGCGITPKIVSVAWNGENDILRELLSFA